MHLELLLFYHVFLFLKCTFYFFFFEDSSFYLSRVSPQPYEKNTLFFKIKAKNLMGFAETQQPWNEMQFPEV